MEGRTLFAKRDTKSTLITKGNELLKEAVEAMAKLSEANKKTHEASSVNTEQVKINVWIGASRVEGGFVWDDGTQVMGEGKYNNWAIGSPSDQSENGCVVMKSEFMRNAGGSTSEVSKDTTQRVDGQWRDVNCDSPNFAICEKLQRWSITKLQMTLLETRTQLSVTQNQLTVTQSDLTSTKNQLTTTQTELTATKTELTSTKAQLATLQSNPGELLRIIKILAIKIFNLISLVPIGFLYVQLPDQPEPSALWPGVQWNEVTSEYAGLFFRAGGGGGAADFGVEQGENAPRVTEVRTQSYSSLQPNWSSSTFNVGKWSSGVGVFSSGNNDNSPYYIHQFHQSGGEIRPRNKAMRLWKRV